MGSSQFDRHIHACIWSLFGPTACVLLSPVFSCRSFQKRCKITSSFDRQEESYIHKKLPMPGVAPTATAGRGAPHLGASVHLVEAKTGRLRIQNPLAELPKFLQTKERCHPSSSCLKSWFQFFFQVTWWQGSLRVHLKPASNATGGGGVEMCGDFRRGKCDQGKIRAAPCCSTEDPPFANVSRQETQHPLFLLWSCHGLMKKAWNLQASRLQRNEYDEQRRMKMKLGIDGPMSFGYSIDLQDPV